MSLRPRPLLRASFDQVAGPLRAALGRPLSRVTYAMPAGVDWLPDATNTLIHEVDMAIALDFEGHQLRIDWAQFSTNEGLALQFASEVPEAWTSSDVQAHPAWFRYIQSVLTEIDLVWHQPEEESAETALGAVFRFVGGMSVTIALGESVGGRPTYMPDEIVVLFDREVAIGYLDTLSVGMSSVGRLR